MEQFVLGIFQEQLSKVSSMSLAACLVAHFVASHITDNTNHILVHR
jgi:hypothetical protein